MIQTILFNVNFGVMPQNRFGEGIELQFVDGESNHGYSIPLPPPAMSLMAEALIDHMTPEQKRELAPKLTGGIVLPGDEAFVPPQNGTKK